MRAFDASRPRLWWCSAADLSWRCGVERRFASFLFDPGHLFPWLALAANCRGDAADAGTCGARYVTKVNFVAVDVSQPRGGLAVTRHRSDGCFRHASCQPKTNLDGDHYLRQAAPPRWGGALFR